MPSFKQLFFVFMVFAASILQADIKSDLDKGLDLKATVMNASERGEFPDQIVKTLIEHKVDPADATTAVIQAFPGYVHATSITRAAISAAPFTSAPKIVNAAVSAASQFEDDITKVAVDAAPEQKSAIKTEADKATPPFVNLQTLSKQIKKEPEKSERQLKENASIGLAGVVLATKGRVTATGPKGQTRVLMRRSKFFANDIIKTAAGSSVQLRFEDKAIMGLRENSELNIKAYKYAGKKKDDENTVVMELVSGGFRTISGSIGSTNPSSYSVSTPAATIGIRGTDYDVVISLDGKVITAVWDGGISITNDLGTLNLGSGSPYIFASFGRGEKPAGTETLPKELLVGNGTATALSAEQKKRLKEVLADSEVSKEIEEFLNDLDEDEEEQVEEEIEAILQEPEKEVETDPIPVVDSPN